MLLAFHEVPGTPSDRMAGPAEQSTEHVLAALEAVAGEESCDDRSLWEKLAKDLYKAQGVRGKWTSEALVQML